MNRVGVLTVLSEEREYQDKKWGTVSEHPHDVGGWLTLIRVYLTRAEDAWASSRGDSGALAEVRKLAALAAACLEQHLTPEDAANPVRKCSFDGTYPLPADRSVKAKVERVPNSSDGS